MGKKKLLTALISLSLLTGATSVFAASAADYETKEYYYSSGNSLLRASSAYALGYTGKGVTVGVCDFPINFATPELAAKTGSRDISNFDMSGKPYYNWDFLAHGTHVAGIIAASKDNAGMHGIAYDANVLGETVATEFAKTTGTFKSRDNLYELYANMPDVKLINNSWGGTAVEIQAAFFPDVMKKIFTQPELAAQKLEGSIFTAVQKLQSQDKLLLFAAGNAGHSTACLESFMPSVYSQAAYNMITVVAGDNISLKANSDGSLSGSRPVTFFSDLPRFEEDYTVAGAGLGIYAADADYAKTGNLDRLMSGTSMATPYVTGVGALVQQAYPYLNAKQIGDVLLSTANNNLATPSYVVTYQNDLGGLVTSFNVFFSGSPADNKMTDDELRALVKNYYVDYYVRANDRGTYTAEAWNNKLEAAYGISTYYYTDLQELWGQGMVDAAKAVKGPGALNARRLTAGDISSDYTVQGTKTAQALYPIDTKGYNSIWGNDIKEIKAGLIAPDSTETDLAKRYLYYYTNWLSGASEKSEDAKFTQLYIDHYNSLVEASGLKGLSVGLLKEGNGTLALTGANTYKGSTVVEGGAIALTGSVAGDAYTLASGTFTGTGTVNGNLNNNGTVVPGLTVDAQNLLSTTLAGTQGAGTGSTATGTAIATTVGTLTVNGNLNGTGTLQIAVNGTDNSKLNVKGATTLTGTTLSLQGSSTLPVVNHTYNYLTSQNGITGNATPEQLPYITINPTVAGNNGYFTAANTTAIGNQPGTTPSENSVGSALQNKAMGAITSDPTSANAQAMNDLFYQNTNTAGRFIKDVTSEARAALLNQSPMSSLTNETVYSRLDTVDFSGDLGITTQAASLGGNAPQVKTSLPVTLDSENNVWFKLFRGFENYNYNDSLENKSFGGAIGYDHALNLSTRIGGLFSYGVTDYNTDNIEGKSYDWRLGVYGSKYNGDWEYQALATYGRNHYDIDRSTAWEGSKVNGDYKAKVWDGEVKARYFVPSTRTKTWQVKPYGKLSYTHTAQDAYAETGSSSFKQSLNSASNNSWRGEIGVELNRNLTNQSSWGGSVGYKRVISGLNPELNGSFTGDTNGFAIRSDNDRNYVTYSLNARSSLGGKWMGQAEFRGEASSNTHKEILSLTAKYSF